MDVVPFHGFQYGNFANFTLHIFTASNEVDWDMFLCLVAQMARSLYDAKFPAPIIANILTPNPYKANFQPPVSERHRHGWRTGLYVI